MSLTREINRLMFGLLSGFILIMIGASYWAITGPETILLREDNPRNVLDRARINRGAIYDRNIEQLTETIPTNNNTIQRMFNFPEMNSALGYFSFRYGTNAAEQAYDAILSGADLPVNLEDMFQQDVLHRARQGSDIQMTLDRRIQEAAVQAMGDMRGAVVVLSVANGDVLSLVSLPSYDPNTLDQDWQTLIEDPGTPFFNRALQGQYQPGGMLQTLLMASMALTRQDVTTVVEDANQTITIDELTLSCALSPPDQNLSFAAAYAYGCPAPFSQLAQQLGWERLQNILSAFNLYDPPQLAGFTPNLPERFVPPEDEADPQQQLIAEAMGQGDLTVAPMTMASIAGAIAVNGNAPQPRALLARRAPGSEFWIPVDNMRASRPLITQETARQLQELMFNNVRSGSAQAAFREGLQIGGHAALSYSGSDTQSWFIGFLNTDSGSIAIAVVLEENDQPAEASRIAGVILEASWQARQNPGTP